MTLKKDKPDWEPWLGFFMRCLKKQKNNLAAKVEKEEAKGGADAALPALSLQILGLFKKRERLTIAEIVEQTEANRNSIKVRLRELVEAGFIQRYGKGCATWYAQKHPN
jgi:Fic family protein